ncbi:Mitochondrial import inner membrane translocase subunit TIM44 [Aphelenchoides besseyi]|nr:Mitochondrial import inner membrane translocase subunit TIM44 [Aphelenchoides besseyi]KAI6208108.1 Mitochondrial import inner membrane translocase subunit TIM44 [Aphelenchoides besseyi]
MSNQLAMRVSVFRSQIRRLQNEQRIRSAIAQHTVASSSIPFHVSIRDYSKQNAQPQKGGNFFSNLISNISEELERNKDLQENKRQLEERLREVGNTEALREARRKFEKVSEESKQSNQVVAYKLKEFKDYVDKMVAEIQTSERGKEMMKQAKQAVESLENAAKVVGDTQAYKQVASTAKSVRDELDGLADVRMYSRPKELKLRSDGYSTSAYANRAVEQNTEATGIELHKDSKWYSGWKSFSENNSYYNKVLDWKTKYDESENPFVRVVRGVTERVGTSQSEVSEVLTEIAKVDPAFDKHEWLRFCEKEVIPNILEAFIRGDLPVLQDWCHEVAFKIMSNAVKEYQKIGFKTSDSRILDISKLELVSGKMMDQGPVLVITFQAFMINVVKNSEGKVVSGDPNNPVRVHHVWVMCRDMQEFNPALAWKLLEIHMQEGSLSI